MLNRQEILDRLNFERRHLAHDGETLEVLPHLVRLRATDNSHHTVISSTLNPDTADAAIAQEIAHHRQLDVTFEWKLFAHDSPPDLLARLKNHGFHIGPREAVLIFDLSTKPNWLTAAKTGNALRIDHEDQLADFRKVAEEVFGKDYAFTTTQLADALRAASTQHRGYIAYANDEPVSIGRLYTHPQSHFAGLYGGGTRRAFRSQGLYRAVVAARAADAIAAGARYLLVDALPTSRPILERIGFEWVTDTWPCEMGD